MKKALLISFIFSFFYFPTYAQSNYDPSDIEIVKEKVNLIKKNVSYNFRLVYVINIIQNDDLLNAWSGGFNIFITTGMLKALNDR